MGALRDPVTLLFTMSFTTLNSFEEQLALGEALLRCTDGTVDTEEHKYNETCFHHLDVGSLVLGPECVLTFTVKKEVLKT